MSKLFLMLCSNTDYQSVKKLMVLSILQYNKKKHATAKQYMIKII